MHSKTLVAQVAWAGVGRSGGARPPIWQTCGAWARRQIALWRSRSNTVPPLRAIASHVNRMAARTIDANARKIARIPAPSANVHPAPISACIMRLKTIGPPSQAVPNWNAPPITNCSELSKAKSATIWIVNTHGKSRAIDLAAKPRAISIRPGPDRFAAATRAAAIRKGRREAKRPTICSLCVSPEATPRRRFIRLNYFMRRSAL